MAAAAGAAAVEFFSLAHGLMRMPGSRARTKARRRLLFVAVPLAIFAVAMTAAWQWTPLHEYADPHRLMRWLGAVADHDALPALILAAFVVGNTMMFPNTALCLATVLALGPLPGFAYATAGSMLAAMSGYATGRYLGGDRVKRLELRSLDRLSAGLRRGGIWNLTLLRLLPLAPFAIVNLMAGVARVRVAPYAASTFLGLLPGNLLLTAFGRQARRLAMDPSPLEAATMAAIVVVATLAIWQLRRLTAPAA